MSRIYSACMTVAFLATLVAFVVEWRPGFPAPAAQPAPRSAESVAVASAIASARLALWDSAVRAAEPDTVLRWATRYVRRLDTVRRVDTVSMPPVEIIRELVVSDSSCRTRSDSLEGALLLSEQSAARCLADLGKKPPTWDRWAAFGVGVGVGMGACLVLGR